MTGNLEPFSPFPADGVAPSPEYIEQRRQQIEGEWRELGPDQDAGQDQARQDEQRRGWLLALKNDEQKKEVFLRIC